MTNVLQFSCFGDDCFNPILIDRQHYCIVEYRTSSMPGDSPIMSSEGLLVVQFDSIFRIWRVFENERLGSLRICIPRGGGPPTRPCRRCDCDKNDKSSLLFV